MTLLSPRGLSLAPDRLGLVVAGLPADAEVRSIDVYARAADNSPWQRIATGRDDVSAAARGVARRAWRRSRDGGESVGIAVGINAALWARAARPGNAGRRRDHADDRGGRSWMAAGVPRVPNRSGSRAARLVTLRFRIADFGLRIDF